MAYRETEKMRQRKAEARKKIIECTWECVSEGGFRSARITRIAGLAGVATGTIYRHFESREDLFAEIFRLATQREVDKVAEALAVGGSAVERLDNALRQFARRALKGPMKAWALIAEPVDPKVEEERLVYRKAYANLFEQAIRSGITEAAYRTRMPASPAPAWLAPSRNPWWGRCHRPRQKHHRDTTTTKMSWSTPSFASAYGG